MWNRELRMQLHRQQCVGSPGQHVDPHADSGL
ncbi:hypothetical protein KYG_02022 [Acidovorax sp. NO-1]|nr:hypothetical protein KYG_02022 [Acidovorax sp. NO-1]